MAGKKIILLFDYHPKHISSAEELYIRLFKELDERGNEIVFVFNKEPHQIFVDRLLKATGKLPRIRVMGFGWPYLRYVETIARLVFEEKPDIIHGNFVPVYFPVNWFSIFGTRFIYTYHGPYDQTIPLWKKALMFSFSRLFDTGIERVVFVSDYLRRKHMEFNSLDRKNLVTVRNGVVLTRFSRKLDVSLFREKEGIPKDCFLVTCISHLVEQKGVQDLIEAFAGFRERHKRAFLLIVGDGSYRSELEEISRQKLGDGYLFMGDRSDVPRIIKASDLIVMPSKFGEGLPYSILESLAGGKAVIATTSGGNAEIISHMDNGYVVRPGCPDDILEGMLRLKEDAVLKRGLEKRAKETVWARFRMRQTLDGYLQVYEKALGQNVVTFPKRIGSGRSAQSYRRRPYPGKTQSQGSRSLSR